MEYSNARKPFHGQERRFLERKDVSQDAKDKKGKDIDKKDDVVCPASFLPVGQVDTGKENLEDEEGQSQKKEGIGPVGRKEIQAEQGKKHRRDAASRTFQPRHEMEKAGNPDTRHVQKEKVKESEGDKEITKTMPMDDDHFFASLLISDCRRA